MANKKLYEVRLVSRSVQTKYVLAKSKREALETANEDEWMEKEQMLDSHLTASLEKEPNHPSNYVTFVNDEGEIEHDRYENVVKK